MLRLRLFITRKKNLGIEATKDPTNSQTRKGIGPRPDCSLWLEHEVEVEANFSPRGACILHALEPWTPMLIYFSFPKFVPMVFELSVTLSSLGQ